MVVKYGFADQVVFIQRSEITEEQTVGLPGVRLSQWKSSGKALMQELVSCVGGTPRKAVCLEQKEVVGVGLEK